MNTRTSSPALWICTRAPSTLYSNAASPSLPSAASTSSAGFASMGATGESRVSVKRARPAAPSSVAARATFPMSPEYMAASRTAAAGRPDARATASRTSPSCAPCRVSPMKSCARKRRSSGPARATSPRSAADRRTAEPAPFAAATSSSVRSTSASVSGSPGADGSASAPSTARQPTPMRPCGSVPHRYSAERAVSRSRVSRRNAAISATFSVFFAVARTRAASSTSRPSSMRTS